MKSASTTRAVCVQLSCWSLSFGLLSLAVAVFWMQRWLPDSKVLPSVLAQLFDSRDVVFATVRNLAIVVGLHLALGVAWCSLWRPLDARWFEKRADRARVALAGFLPVLLWVLVANAALFPRSGFAPDFGAAGGAVFAALLVALSAYLAAVVVCACILSLTARIAILLAVLAVGAAWLPASAPEARTPRAAPDVIVIGVDSLRTDHVGELTPNLAALLDGAAVFADAWTPLGRTFPALLSVFTGRYPAGHGALFNLTPRARVDDTGSLPHALGALGYDRVLAIDETRFANFDHSFGFDRIIAPAIGAFDFVGGTIADQPLMNLVRATTLGRRLFPHQAMNRAIPATYQPAVFDRAIAAAIRRTAPEQPLLLVAHFELPHWPYTWSNEIAPPRSPALSTPADYRAAVAEADRQVGRLVEALRSAGRLEDAIVVVLSDHGEAFIGSEPSRPSLPPSAGHGTNPYSDAQNRVVLAFRGYGPQATRVQRGVRASPVASLADVWPTLREWLALPAAEPLRAAGSSLLTWVEDARAPAVPRVVTVETGFSPPALRGGDAEARAVLREGAEYYEVRNGRAVLREEWIARLAARKQYAAIDADWLYFASGDAVVARGTAPRTDAPVAALRAALHAHGCRAPCG